MTSGFISLLDLAYTWRLTSFILSAYVAMAVVGMIVGLLSWQVLKEKVYLLFAVYILSILGIVAFVEFPLAVTEVLPEDIFKLKKAVLIAGFANFAHILFTRELIQPQKNTPKLYKFWLLVIAFLFSMDLLTLIFSTIDNWNRRNLVLMLYTMTSLVLLAKASVKMPFVRWYTYGVVVFIIGNSPLILYNSGIIKNLNEYTAGLPYVAAFIENLFFIIGIIFRLKFEYERNLQEEKLKMLGSLAAEVFHEVAAPLSVIYGYSRIIKNDVEQIEELNELEPVKLNIQKIMTNIDRVSKNIEKFKMFAQDGYTESSKEMVSVKLIIESAIELSQVRIENKKVKFEYEINEIESINILANKFELEQAVSNVLRNAADAAAETPDKWVKLSATSKNSQIVISICDSGSGLPESVRKEIFKPFFTTKKIGEGTGVGLSLSSKFINAHKGSIKIDKNSVNTCFIITLPIV